MGNIDVNNGKYSEIETIPFVINLPSIENNILANNVWNFLSLDSFPV
jgi:hypothetical protein